MDLTPAELTVLGLLVEQPRHGYDLDRVIEHRGMRQWTDIGFSSIYSVLTKLERRNLIGSDHNRAGATSRRVFHATTAGQEVAADEALAYVADLRTVPQRVLVGLANLALVDEDDYVEALRGRLTQVETRIASVRDAAQSQAPLPHAAREVFSYSLALLEAERSWLAERAHVSHE